MTSKWSVICIVALAVLSSGFVPAQGNYSTTTATALNSPTTQSPEGNELNSSESTATVPQTTPTTKTSEETSSATTSTSADDVTQSTGTTAVPTSPGNNTTVKTSNSTSSFDVGSFFGGFVLCAAIVVIIYLGCKMFRTKKPDYNTL